MKKRVWKTGGVVKIPIEGGLWAFGRLLKKPLIAFYDLRSKDVPPIDRIVASPIEFKIWVMTRDVTNGDWTVIGNKPLTPDLEVPPSFFKRDPISRKLSIYYGAGKERDASAEECTSLECAAVWSAQHVVDRLNDHFSGKLNKWVQSMKP